ITQKVENTGAKPVTLSPYGLISRHGTPPTLGYSVLHEGPIGVLQDKLAERSYKDLISKTETLTTTGGWLGFTDKYWLTALIPEQSATVPAHFEHFASPAYKDVYQVDDLGAAVEVPAGGSVASTGRVFTRGQGGCLLRGYEFPPRTK